MAVLNQFEKVNTTIRLAWFSFRHCVLDGSTGYEEKTSKKRSTQCTDILSICFALTGNKKVGVMRILQIWRKRLMTSFLNQFLQIHDELLYIQDARTELWLRTLYFHIPSTVWPWKRQTKIQKYFFHRCFSNRKFQCCCLVILSVPLSEYKEKNARDCRHKGDYTHLSSVTVEENRYINEEIHLTRNKFATCAGRFISCSWRN